VAVSLPTLLQQEVPGAPEALVRAFNDLSRQLQTLLSGGLTVDNANAFIVTATLPQDQTFPVRLKNQLQGGKPPVGVLIIRASDKTAKGKPSVSVGTPGWEVSGDNVHLTSISGLTTGHAYELVVLVLGSSN
jgi:hypothetical protein